MSVRKIVYIIFLLLTGCSAFKKGTKNEIYMPVISDEALTARIFSMNVTKTDFNIPRADIEIFNNGKSQRLIANLKYRNPGIYLAAIKNRSGIEAARIYITRDTIMINDRIIKNYI